MTLKEAIESGKPFRRRGRPEQYERSWFDKQYAGEFSREDVLATDWEIKTGPRKFTLVKMSDGWLVFEDPNGRQPYYDGEAIEKVIVQEVIAGSKS